MVCPGEDQGCYVRRGEAPEYGNYNARRGRRKRGFRSAQSGLRTGGGSEQIHGQKGHAERNRIELHPVLRFSSCACRDS